ncbi:MAG TPA: hypothetical protein VL401_03135 [Alphaproteobacteria bacterium]|jgi:hypothetical protein|nr:hypothetical protein [Alphaproteobacteria bacterium]
MTKHLSKIIILACFLISAVSVLYILKASQKPVPFSQKTSYVPPVAIADSPKLTEIISPDGKDKLSVKEEKTKENIIYTFTTSKQKFTKTVPLETSILVPFNTFSPDDKYFFLQEGDTYFVPLKDEVLDINAMFAAKHPEYKITEATGWGGMTLIVINTDKTSGGIGPSFWFDVTSKSFIQLSTRFN